MGTTAFMRDLQKRYEKQSGLTDIRYYKIYYSRVRPSEILVLGINPGGNPLEWNPDPNEKIGIKSFYKDKHDYVDCNYDTAVNMKPLLMAILESGNSGVRKVVKTNLAFRRSEHLSEFSKHHGMTYENAALEAHPFLEEIIRRTDPRLIILEGDILRRFIKLYCENEGLLIDEIIKTPCGKTPKGKTKFTDLYDAREVYVTCLDRKISVIKLAHPSTFGPRYEKNGVFDKVKTVLHSARV